MRTFTALLLSLGLTGLSFAAESETAAKDAPAGQPKAESKEKAADKPAAAKDEGEVDPVLMMPEYQVSSSRIDELDIQIKKLDKTIAKAKKRLKPSELDETLNGDNVPTAMLIFGGKTAAQRRSVAAERVHLMETERDILEAMKHVRSKQEEEELKTQLNAFKTMRRELDETLR